MTAPHEFVTAITYTKEDLFENETEAENDYVPFVVNRGLSYHIDCLLAAQEMNMRPHIPKKNQFRYLTSMIHKGKRYAKWGKPAESKLSLVMEFYKCGKDTARQYMSLMTEDDYAGMVSRLNKEPELASTRGKSKGKS